MKTLEEKEKEKKMRRIEGGEQVDEPESTPESYRYPPAQVLDGKTPLLTFLVLD